MSSDYIVVGIWWALGAAVFLYAIARSRRKPDTATFQAVDRLTGDTFTGDAKRVEVWITALAYKLGDMDVIAYLDAWVPGLRDGTYAMLGEAHFAVLNPVAEGYLFDVKITLKED